MRVPSEAKRKRTMKTIHTPRLTFCLSLGSALWLSAAVGLSQVEIGVELEHRSVVEFEPIVVTIAIRNAGETPLVFSEFYRNAELLVAVHPQGAMVRPQRDHLAIKRDLVIMPGNVAKEVVELSSMVALHEEGNYRITAQVRYEGKTFSSRQVIIKVVRGIELITRESNIWGYENIRLTYELRYWKRDESEYLFLIVKDKQNGLSYGTFQLGRIIRFFQPEIRFGDKGRVTVIHQSGRKRFTRSVFDPGRDGVLFSEQTHHMENGDPFPGSSPKLAPGRTSP